MSDSVKLLENTKQEIRSILLTSPKGSPLRKFCSEYRDIIGHPLPFRALGYNASDKFLASIPDVVRMQWSSQIDDYLLTAVADKTTKHIEKLVSKQRVNRNTPSLRKSQQIYSHCTFSQPFRVRPTDEAFLPAAIKVKINQIMGHYVDGIDLTNFLLVYKKNAGKELNFENLGFNTLEECLESVPGLVIHKKNQQPRIYMLSVIGTKNNAPTSIKKHKESALIRQKRNTLQSNSGYTSSYAYTRNSSSKYLDSNNVDMLDAIAQPDKKNGMGENSGISDVMQQTFKKILKTHPDGIWARKFCDAYQELTNRRLDLPELGYFSLIDLVDALPAVFTRHQPAGCKSDWLLFSADNTPNEKLPLCDLKNTDSIGLNGAVGAVIFIDNIIINTKRILQANPEGVFLNNFIHLYSINCEEALQLNHLGFDNIEDFLLSIAERVPLRMDYSSAAEKKVYFKHSIDLECLFPNYRFLKNIPNDAVLPGAEYAFQTLPTTILNSKSYFPVLLGTVVKPDRFWIILEGKETSQALEELMNELQEFYYGKQGDLYKMENKHILIGSICAGTWMDSNWHRIHIISIDDCTGYVYVKYVDYGTRGKVHRSNLRYLKEDFLKLPMQALESRLAFIEPVCGETWNTTVKDRFLNFGMGKTLMALTFYSPCHEDLLNLWLCDTNGEQDIHINRALVVEGFAVYCSEINTDEEPKQPSKPKAWNCSSTDPNFSSAADRHADMLEQMNIIRELSTFLKDHAAASTINGKKSLINSLLYALNPESVVDSMQSSEASQIQKILSGADTVLLRRLFTSLSSQLPTNALPCTQSSSSKQFFQTENVNPSGFQLNTLHLANSQLYSVENSVHRRAEPRNLSGTTCPAPLNAKSTIVRETTMSPVKYSTSPDSGCFIRPPMNSIMAKMQDKDIASMFNNS